MSKNYIYETTYTEGGEVRRTLSRGIKSGISFGSCLAMVVSYVSWQSVGWAIIHGLFGWFYVLYFLVRYCW